MENSGGECIVERCAGPTAVQGFASGLLGREVDLQYRRDITVDALPTQELQFGFSQSETEETVVETQQMDEWVYEFRVVGDSGFRDRMAFDTVDPDDPWGHLTQVFGPDFGDAGSTFDAEHEALCPEDQMFWFDDMTAGLLTSPFGEALTQ